MSWMTLILKMKGNNTNNLLSSSTTAPTEAPTQSWSLSLGLLAKAEQLLLSQKKTDK